MYLDVTSKKHKLHNLSPKYRELEYWNRPKLSQLA